MATVPALIQSGINNCPTRISGNEDMIAAACEEYLTAEVENGTPQAVFLNSASAAEVEACATGDNCNLAFITSLVDGLSQFIASGDSADLAVLLAPVVATCL
jgi:hypothetical protein